MLILSLALTIGVKAVFHACGPTEEGMWMSCHWAQESVFGTGLLLCALSAFSLFAPSSLRLRRGLSVAILATAILTLMLPGTLISLCMMNTMRCHTLMRPAVNILAALIAAAATGDLYLSRGDA